MKTLSLVIALMIAGLLAACGSVTESERPTPHPTATVSTTPTVEAQVSTGSAQGDPAIGRQLFSTFQPRVGTTCTACHRVDSDDRLIGPGLLHVGERAATRVPGLDAVEYVRASIVSPSAYVVDGYPDIMPKNWSDAFTEDQLNDLVVYLLSLSTPDTVASAPVSNDHSHRLCMTFGAPFRSHPVLSLLPTIVSTDHGVTKLWHAAKLALSAQAMSVRPVHTGSLRANWPTWY